MLQMALDRGRGRRLATLATGTASTGVRVVLTQTP